MAITSLGFQVFLMAAVSGYYLLPQKHKWKLLLAVSLIFVAACDFRGIVFLAAASLSIWFAGKKIALLRGTGRPGSREKGILIGALVLNIGILAVLKYLLPTAMGILKTEPAFKIFIPVGLSYYTLQAVSYVMDVYWGKIQPEKSWLRVLLFVGYFPQLLQGPISRYQQLSGELYEKDHRFQIRNIKHGAQLMLWGFFKMLVISDRASGLVADAFHGGQTACGLAAFLGLVLFGIQLYCNFSGGIDLVRGISECFGVILTDNFRQPFFAASLGEFWRRWHITLGSWMKDYIFYPFSMSHAVSGFKKRAKKYMSRKWANRIPIAGANLVVFLLVGVWHGLGTNYVLWGLYNGAILAVSELMTDVFRAGKQRLHISDGSAVWHGFSVVRTFLIVTLGWCTDCASTASGSFNVLKNAALISQTDFGIFTGSLMDYLAVGLGVVCLIAVSVLHEKKISIRASLDQRNGWVQMLFWIMLIQLIALFRGTSAAAGEFIYADF